MITPALLRPYMGAMATAISCNAFQENQKGPRPDYPILGFRLIVQNIDEEYMARVSTADLSATQTEKTTSLHDRGTISISVRDTGNGDSVADKAAAALEWIRSQEGKDAAAAAGILIRRFSPAVSDRTVQTEDQDFEYRWGFDVRADFHHTTTEAVERVQSVIIQAQSPPYDAEEIEVSA